MKKEKILIAVGIVVFAVILIFAVYKSYNKVSSEQIEENNTTPSPIDFISVVPLNITESNLSIRIDELDKKISELEKKINETNKTKKKTTSTQEQDAQIQAPLLTQSPFLIPEENDTESSIRVSYG